MQNAHFSMTEGSVYFIFLANQIVHVLIRVPCKAVQYVPPGYDIVVGWRLNI